MPDLVTLLVILLGAGTVYAAYHFLGGKAAMVAAGAAVLAVLYRLGRRDERRDLEEKEKDDALEIHREASEARADADRRNADPGRLRDDDGWRRD